MALITDWKMLWLLVSHFKFPLYGWNVSIRAYITDKNVFMTLLPNFGYLYVFFIH